MALKLRCTETLQNQELDEISEQSCEESQSFVSVKNTDSSAGSSSDSLEPIKSQRPLSKNESVYAMQRAAAADYGSTAENLSQMSIFDRYKNAMFAKTTTDNKKK